MPTKPSPRDPFVAAAKALIDEAMRPAAIDISGGLYTVIREAVRRGEEIGRHKMASKGGKHRKIKAFGDKMMRWRVISGYFAGAGRQARARPFTKERLSELQARLSDKGIKVSYSTIKADVRELGLGKSGYRHNNIEPSSPRS